MVLLPIYDESNVEGVVSTSSIISMITPGGMFKNRNPIDDLQKALTIRAAFSPSRNRP